MNIRLLFIILAAIAFFLAALNVTVLIGTKPIQWTNLGLGLLVVGLFIVSS